MTWDLAMLQALCYLFYIHYLIYLSKQPYVLGAFCPQFILKKIGSEMLSNFPQVAQLW